MDKESLGDCQKCGANLDMVGKAHRCVTRPVTPLRTATKSLRDVTKPTVKPLRPVTGKRCPLCGADGWAGPKSAAARMKAYRARRKK